MLFTKPFNRFILKKKTEELYFSETKRKIIFYLYGRKIHVYKYFPSYNKVIFWVHGMGSNHRVPPKVLDIAKDLEVSVYSIDLPGHGKSKPLGVTTFSECLEALYCTFKYLKDTHRYPEVFIAHSMGCSLLIHYLAKFKRTNERVILLSPPLWISAKKDLSVSLYSYKYIFKAIFFPESYTNILDSVFKFRALEGENISEKYKNILKNSIPTYKYMNKSLCDLIRNILRTPYYLSKIDSPNIIYIFHGLKDEVCDVRGSIYAYKLLKSKGIITKLFVIKNTDHTFYRFKFPEFVKLLKKSLVELFHEVYY